MLVHVLEEIAMPPIQMYLGTRVSRLGASFCERSSRKACESCSLKKAWENPWVEDSIGAKEGKILRVQYIMAQNTIDLSC